MARLTIQYTTRTNVKVIALKTFRSPLTCVFFSFSLSGIPNNIGPVSKYTLQNNYMNA